MREHDAPLEASPGQPRELQARLEGFQLYLPVVVQWTGLRIAISIVAAASLCLIPLPRSPQALRLDPSLAGYVEVTQWLAQERGPAFYWLETL